MFSTSFQVLLLGLIPFSVATTASGYPVMLSPEAPTPPPKELITEIFLAVFQSEQWKESGGPSIDAIKFPFIHEDWLCHALFYDEDGKFVDQTPTAEEELTTDPAHATYERLLSLGHRLHWHITSPHTPEDEFATWCDAIPLPSQE